MMVGQFWFMGYILLISELEQLDRCVFKYQIYILFVKKIIIIFYVFNKLEESMNILKRDIDNKKELN